jgi:hypothetical protein
MTKETSFASDHQGQRQALTLINFDLNKKLDHWAFSGASNVNASTGLNAHGFSPSLQPKA